MVFLQFSGQDGSEWEVLRVQSIRIFSCVEILYPFRLD
jgi:hypothetical protein